MSNKLVYRSHVFTDADMVSGSTSRAQSLNMRELTVDSAQFVLRQNALSGFFSAEPFPFFTRDRKRLYTSETVFFDGVTQDEPVKQYINGSQVAIWHQTAIERLSSDTYRLTVTSPLGLLLQRTHYGGIYTGQTVSAVVSEIIGAGVPYYIEPEFRGIALYGWLPIANARENLLQTLFAINAALTTDEDGTLRIGNLSTLPSETVDAGDIYAAGATVEYLAPITRVVVLEHNYVPGQDRETLFEGMTEQGQLIQFRKPVANLEATGFAITESGANYARVSAGTGTLTGVPYIDMTREVTANVTIAAVENEVRIEEATLVGVTAAPDVVRRLQVFYRHRKKIVISVADKLPRGVISAYEPYERQIVPACVESAELALSAVEKTRISAIVDYSPWQTTPFEDVRVLLTGTGTWTVPSDVPAGTEVQVVLIGGGQGGGKGNAGSAAPAYRQYAVGDTGPTTIPNSQGYSSRYNGAGAGGSPGVAGAGGKIARVTMSVSPGDTMAFSCGTGGAGELYNGESTGGANGTDTTFGTFSSADGAPSSSGYLDPITQTVYASPGDAGMKGGDGVGFVDDQLVTPPDIVVDGVTYSAGGRVSTEMERESGGDAAVEPGRWVLRGEYGYGGGNAYKANGGTAITAPYVAASSSTGNCFASPAAGGNGATAQAPPAATTYGKGGTSGNGGGGGGAFGATQIECMWLYGISHGTARLDSMPAATGGDGSAGGDGGDGCIILYYRQPVA